MAEDCVVNSMLRASCVHSLESQTCTCSLRLIRRTCTCRSNFKGAELLAKDHRLKTVFRRNFGLENKVFGKEEEEKGITCNSCYFTMKIHKVGLPSITKNGSSGIFGR